MVVADAQGVPLGGYLCSASPAEVTLVDATLACVDKNVLIQRLIADKAYDSQSLRDEMADQQIELIAPHRKKQKTTQNTRWSILTLLSKTMDNGSPAFGASRLDGSDSLPSSRAFFHVACLIITMRHLCNDF